MIDVNEEVDRLESEWGDCERCSLSRNRQSVVFGEGSLLEGTVMLIGEAPGADEDALGLPFVGPSGKLLDELLLFHGSSERLWSMQEDFESGVGVNYDALREALIEDERLYYTNVCACRPEGNRDPNRQEIDACKPRLLELIYLIDPIAIVTLGKPAAKAVLRRAVKVTKERGRILEAKLPGREVAELRYPVMPLLHPAFILREGSHDREGSRAQLTDEDLERLFHMVDLSREKLLGEDPPRRYA